MGISSGRHCQREIGRKSRLLGRRDPTHALMVERGAAEGAAPPKLVS